MNQPSLHILTIIPPLLSVIVCVLGAVFCYRLASRRRMWRSMAALCSFVMSVLPIGFAIAAAGYGNHLAREHNDFSFFGEATWGLFLLTVFYMGFALFCNVVLWAALVLLGSHRNIPAEQNK